MKSRIALAWMDFFFRPQAPINLAVCRILFFGLLATYYFGHDFAKFGSFPSEMWRPTGPFQVVHAPLLSEATLTWMQHAWWLALVGSMLGAATRVSTVTALTIGVYLLGLRHNFGFQSHADNLIVVVLILMALSRCGAAWSVDGWLRRRSGSATSVAPSGDFTWPIRCVQLTFAIVFFTAGYAKLRTSGLAWVFSDNMSYRIILAPFYFPDTLIITSLASWVASQSWLCKFMAGATIVLEIGYPLALFYGWARWIFVPSMFLAQAAILVLMGPEFFVFMGCNLFWLPWEKLMPGLRETTDIEEAGPPTESTAWAA